MWSRRNTTVSLFTAMLALLTLFGCRAFEPEVVIVNKTPETFIIGAPAETSGGYFHYHVYWYGSDADGAVERFVWALTDTQLQDEETDEDEEDQIFNPSENISTLEIGNWTARTDSVFDFRLNAGPNLAKNLTLHMVAVDDRGDFDRTPARLHFISNALGNPAIEYVKVLPGGAEEPFANTDTIAFGEPLELRWQGSTPNIRAYDPELLAERDTVPPLDDGLFGFQWRIPGEVGDVWRPRAFNEATGDSFSYFGAVNRLIFANDGSGATVFGRRLTSGILRLLVNTIDVAGVQIPGFRQELNIVVNYDPVTEFVVGRDPDYPTDDREYPYYVTFFGPNAGVPRQFAEGDTVPDGAYVVFKARGRDNPLDQLQNPADHGVDFVGAYAAQQRYDGGNYYPFVSDASAPSRTEAWTATAAGGWSSDTLGFVVGPYEYTMRMRAVDEHNRRDGTAPEFHFVGNYPPCVQCIELLNNNESATVVWDDPCYQAACFADTTAFYVKTGPPYNPDRRYMSPASPVDGTIWVKTSTGEVYFEQPAGTGYVAIASKVYTVRVFLHGKEGSDDERTADNTQRIMAWSYQVDYDNDPINQIPDGGGIDRLGSWTEEYFAAPADPNFVDPFIDSQGVWFVRVKVHVPALLAQFGPDVYYGFLVSQHGASEAPQIWTLTTKQLGGGSIRARATDAASCEARFVRGKYYWYRDLRIPGEFNPGRRCDPGAASNDVLGSLLLEDFRAVSETVQKHFRFVVETASGDYDGGPPPN